MAADVHFLSVPDSGDGLTGPPLPGVKLRQLAERLAGDPVAGPWALKIELGAPGRPAAVPPAWAAAVAAALGPGAFVCDTLSITTPGLETETGQRDAARAKGYGEDPGFRVLTGPGDEGEAPAEPAPAPLPAGVAGLASLNPVRPHPHLGFHGAVAAVGIGLVDRTSKIALHRDIRPQVDTPLCAGCGVCLTVCLFDAIVLRAGRAHIDHEACVGCGECMNVCFMAGIEPEEAAGVPRFQARVAEAARAVLRQPACGRALHMNLLLGMDRSQAGPRSRRRRAPAWTGVLASSDPVALDQATWDVLTDDGDLKDWGGFARDPGALLERAAEIGLGGREYRRRDLPV